MADLELAEKLINKELRFKTIMSQWANYFLARSHTETLDMLSWSFARFSLNICFGWAEIAPRHLIQAGIHKSLGDLIKFRSELVVGPALMALVHISIHDEMKPAITLINVLSTIIKLMVTSESKPVLCQCCKLVASLALHFPNKTLITNSGCMHGLLDLVLGTNKEIDDSISYAFLTGVVNTVCGNDANRLLICDLNGIKPILSIMQNTSDNKILEQAVRCLGNICYCNSFCAGEMLSQGADVIIVEVLKLRGHNVHSLTWSLHVSPLWPICALLRRPSLTLGHRTILLTLHCVFWNTGKIFSLLARQPSCCWG